jgi:hypothetical protein
VLHTVHKLITATEYRYQHERATSASELSPPLQALLQTIDAIQPATAWEKDGQNNTATFTPVEVDYNPLRLQSMPTVIFLTHPESPSTPTRYLIRPPRLRSDLRGDTHWAPWWRTALLIQSTTPLPIPSMSVHDPTNTQGYLHQALTQGMEMANSFLASLTLATPDHLNATPTLQPTPYGAYIISHVRKDHSS